MGKTSLGSVVVVAIFVGVAAPASAHHLGEPEAFERALSQAERHFNHSRHAEALALYIEAERLATRENNRVYAGFQRALALRRLARAAEARDALLSLARRWPRHEKTPRALYVAARILESDLRDARGGEREHLALMRRFPRSDAAGRSLLRVAQHREARSTEDAIEFLRDAYRHNKKRPLGPRALYLGAKLFEEKLRAPDDAIRLYELLARRYPKHGLHDDALWYAAQLHRAARRPERAIKLLQRLVATKRESWALGSYNSVHLDKAGLLIAEIWLEDLKDWTAGEASLREFIDGFPHSFLRAKARGRHVATLIQLGRVPDAKSALAELAKHHPQSRYTKIARDLVDRARPSH